MQRYVVQGGKKLKGNIDVSGAKNSSLPILVSTLLMEEDATIYNAPQVSDISITLELLRSLGSAIELTADPYRSGKKIIRVNSKGVDNPVAPQDLVNRMRASFLSLGPILARMGKATIPLPGGCAIGARPVDIHLEALAKMGAKLELQDGFVHASIDGRFKGADITFKFPSVGATQHIVMAAVLAEGTTTINNVSKEPETIDVIKFLMSAGAQIEGVGTDTLTIHGVEKLHSTQYTIIGDRIEAGTYMMAALITDGDCILKGLDFEYALGNVMDVLREIGADIEYLNPLEIRIKRGKEFKPHAIDTEVFPGFPTDLQPQIMALLANIDGDSIVEENLYENRFRHVEELNKLGANIVLENNNKAIVHGCKGCFANGEVSASDLRAGAALILAALAAKGCSYVYNPHFIQRGYENLVEKLNACGADIQFEE